MKHYGCFSLICALLFAGWSNEAGAAIVNLGFTNAIVGGNANGATYSEDGFTITKSSGGSAGTWGIGGGSGFGTNLLDFHDHNLSANFLTLTETNATTFNLLNMQFRIEGTYEAPMTITNNLGGSVTLLYDNTNTNARTHVFDSTWSNLTWVRIDSQYDATIGNINIESEPAAVPEPASLVIWGGIGLVGLVAARRRKKLAD